MTTTLFTEHMRARMPAVDADESTYPPAFAAIADLLLNHATLHVGSVEHRFTEIEFYFKGRKHVDKFTHGDPMQKKFGHWYFHRTGGEYRSGTYKGLDIAFGGDDAPGGILIRGIERTAPPVTLIDGPCMVVDHMLALTQSPSIPDLVAKFDLTIDPAKEGTSPVYVTHYEAGHGKTVYESPRVGLTLKRANTPDRHRFIARNYRFLSEPERIKKGKLHLIVALHRRGLSPTQIAAVTATKPSVIKGYLDAYEEGRAKDPSEYSSDLSTGDTCGLFGACEKLHATTA
jgi:3-methyladenine DNA glycosylase Mpg